MSGDNSSDKDPAQECAEFEAKMEETIEAYHQLARLTQNHVYAWLALLACGWMREGRALRGLPPKDLVIPGWCAEYFTATAWQICGLADGSDFRKPLPEEAWDAPGVLNDKGKIQLAEQKLSPDEAASLLSQALGITSPGFNMFKDFRKRLSEMHTFNRFDELRTGGLRYSDALAAMAEELPSLEESVLRRKVTAGRRLVQGHLAADDQPPDDTGKT